MGSWCGHFLIPKCGMVLACCWSSIVTLLMERCSITEAVTSGRRSQIQCLYNLILFLCNHCKNSFVDIEFVVRIFWSGFAYFSKPLLYQCIIETSHHVTHNTTFRNTCVTTAAPFAAAFAASTVWQTSHDEQSSLSKLDLCEYMSTAFRFERALP